MTREYYLEEKLKLFKKEKSMVGHIVVLVAVVVVGVAGVYFSGKQDAVIEEIAEEVIESEMEQIFHLHRGELEGKIDLTPASKEDEEK